MAENTELARRRDRQQTGPTVVARDACAMTARLAAIAAAVDRCGFVYVPRREMLELLPRAAREAWPDYAVTWDDLGPDTYMADAGRYRRRRYAVYRLTATTAARKPHQPHYQHTDYNPLNGGVRRWFEAVTQAAADSPVTAAVLDLCQTLFSSVEADATPAERHVEMHQFRIEPARDGEGRPTPEGMHRDGVDWACVLLVSRTNIEHGATRIQDLEGRALGTFTLTDPLDAVFFDDRRVMHGVTAVRRAHAAQPGFRDVLVITFGKD